MLIQKKRKTLSTKDTKSANATLGCKNALKSRHDMEGTFRPNRVEYIGNIDPTTSMIKMKRANLSGHAWAENCNIRPSNITERNIRKSKKNETRCKCWEQT